MTEKQEDTSTQTSDADENPTPPENLFIDTKDIALHFSPYAWNKLRVMLHHVPTEAGGLAFTRDETPFLVEDIIIPKQQASSSKVEFDDDSVMDIAEEMYGQGFTFNNFLRIWIHTHPGNNANPSSLDEDTFEECFGEADWAIMFIIAKGGNIYCRLRFNQQLTPIRRMAAVMELKTSVVYTKWFSKKEAPPELRLPLDEWRKELDERLRPFEAVAVKQFPHTHGCGMSHRCTGGQERSTYPPTINESTRQHYGGPVAGSVAGNHANRVAGDERTADSVDPEKKSELPLWEGEKEDSDVAADAGKSGTEAAGAKTSGTTDLVETHFQALVRLVRERANNSGVTHT